MRRRPAAALPLVVALLAAACQAPGGVGPADPKAGPKATAAPKPGTGTPGPAATATPAGPRSPGALPVVAATGLVGTVRAPATLLANNGAGLLSDNGLGIVSNHGAGVVSNAGGAVVSNNGGAVVSNNGGAVVSNNGGALTSKTKYGLAQADARLEQFFLADAEVALVGADGQPVRDAAGAAITARTGADGRYALPAAPRDRNAVVVVRLPGGKGELRAIAPRAAGATVEVDLVSTLATTYILDRYVATQADKQATLDKLPADVEATTRARAAAAFVASAAAPPDAATAEKVVAVVDALRQGDAALNGQLDEVKRLLIAAGQSDLGAGQLATDVALSGVARLAIAPDGTLLFTTRDYTAAAANRLWRLGADGRLAKVAEGAIEAFAARPDGTLAWTENLTPNNPFEAPKVRLSRLAPGGAPEVVETDVRAGEAPAFAADGALVLFAGCWRFGPPRLHRYPGPPPYPAAVAIAPATLRTTAIAPVARDAAGGLWLLAGEGPDATLYQVDAVTGQATARATGVELGARALALDARGDLLYLAAGGLMRRTPAGATSTLWAAPPAGFTLDAPAGVALAADGTAYFARGTQVVALAGGQTRVVAGKAAAVAADTAARLDLTAASGVAAAADGTLYLSDAGAHRVYRVASDGAVTTFAGTGTAGAAPDGTAAAAAALTAPTDVRLDGAGRLAFIDGRAVRRADPAKAGAPLETLFSEDRTSASLLTAGPDGTLYVRAVTTATGDAPTPFSPGTYRLVALRADGTKEELLAGDAALKDVQAMAADATGLLLLANGRLDRWTRAEGRKTLVEMAFKTFPGGFIPLPPELTVAGEVLKGYPAGLAVGPEGRVYLAFRSPANRVVRLDPTTGALAIVAGKGGAAFAGAGVDDGLDDPLAPTFAPTGDLLVVDANHRQVKRIPASKL